MKIVFALVLPILAAACSSTGGQPAPDAGSDSNPQGDSGPGNAAWTAVATKDPAGAGIQVSGFWFESTTNGFVSFDEGYVEHFSSPTQIDKIALDGHGKAPNGQDDAYFGFLPNTSLGLVVRNQDASELVISTDKGATFNYVKSYAQTAKAPQTVSPDWPLIWLGSDPSSAWHMATLGGVGGDVWASPTAPSPTATLTDTWHPAGAITVPATIPAADCNAWVVNSYYSSEPGWVFTATTDGKAMIYSSNDGASGAICRSTDGGKNFVDVSANISPTTFSSSNVPWSYLFTSPTVGIGFYGSDSSGPGSAYVLYTSDGGSSWTVGTLPTSAGPGVDLISAFASPSGTMFIVGGTGAGPLLVYKSTDGGKTWTDISAKLQAFENTVDNAPLRLTAGFALDDQNIWVGGEGGFVAYSSTGGQ
ncbi:MAG TPA: sialidase family protein [Polyangiaceae bacterium]|jgi:hypothetical protein